MGFNKKAGLIGRAKELFGQNYSCRKIAKEIGVSKQTVLRWMKEEGLDTTVFKTPNKRQFIDKNEIKDLYLSGLSTNDLSRKYNLDNKVIWKFLVQIGVSVRPVRKNHFNENFFEKIDTEEKAYCLGLMFTDGWVSTKLDYAGIQMTDLDVIEKFACAVGYTGSIKTILPRKPSGIIYNQYGQRQIYPFLNMYRLNLSSKIMKKDLINCGCIPKKSLILKYPTCVTEDLTKHFIRGVLDGDGSISGNTICISGCKDFLDGVNNVIELNCGFSFKRYQNINIWNYMTSKIENTRKFLNFVYKNASIYMNRKFNKAKEFYEKYGE